MLPAIIRFLSRARRAGIFVAFTISAGVKGTPLGEPYSGFNRKETEPLIFPDGFDKFVGGELQSLLKPRGIDTLIICGWRFNIAVLYTATTAARNLTYNVIIPMDGVEALLDYEKEYTFHQLATLPGKGVVDRIVFTTLDKINFG